MLILYTNIELTMIGSDIKYIFITFLAFPHGKLMCVLSKLIMR